MLSPMQVIPWLGPAVAGVFIALHLAFARLPLRPQVALLVFAAVFGVLADLVLIHGGDVVYQGMPASDRFGPAWIIALWMAFAPTVNVSFAWLRDRACLGALFGGVGGVIAYEGGRRLGVVSYDPFEIQTAIALVAVWGIAIPLFVQMAHWCEEEGWSTRALDSLRGLVALPEPGTNSGSKGRECRGLECCGRRGERARMPAFIR